MAVAHITVVAYIFINLDANKFEKKYLQDFYKIYKHMHKRWIKDTIIIRNKV